MDLDGATPICISGDSPAVLRPQLWTLQQTHTPTSCRTLYWRQYHPARDQSPHQPELLVTSLPPQTKQQPQNWAQPGISQGC